MRVKKTTARLPKRAKNSPKWHQLLSDFERSDKDTVELVPDPGEYKNLRSAQSTTCTAIRRYGFNMKTVQDGGKLYLVKTLSQSKK